jgi:hypothetical protein
MSSGRRQLSIETIALFVMGAIFLAAGAFLCVTAYRAGQASVGALVGSNPAESVAELSPALPPAQPPIAEPQPASTEYAPAPEQTSIFASPTSVEATPEPEPAPQTQVDQERPTSPSIVLGSAAPFPAPRPIDLNDGPAGRPIIVDLGPKPASLSQYDRYTAVYDLIGHTVYLPNGERLEAHSGLGALKDDPAHVNEADRGATPPHIYDLTMREDLFHGVQALRLNPIGGAASIFGRAGLLAHTYMLGPNGDSNGCVSFKNYDAFLQAFRNGLVRKLAVVSSVK